MRVAFVALAVVVLAGCGKVGSGYGNTSQVTTVSNGGAQVRSVGDLDAGKLVFTNNCSTCHGATGREGGIGPSLRNESKRKNYDATIDWIKHPAPPMPKLYPSPLDDREVNDVAAYVQSL